jgi:large subunit ribosomal protein L21
MYAVLKHGGHQYRVSAGDRLLVDRIAAEVGSTVTLEPVLLVAGDGPADVGNGAVAGAKVTAIVVAHRRGRKIRVFTYKPKKRRRRTMGHRSQLTELRIESVAGADGKAHRAPAAAAAPRPKPAARAGEAEGAAAAAGASVATPVAKPAPAEPAPAKPAAAKPATAKPATAKPATAKPAPAAKAPAAKAPAAKAPAAPKKAAAPKKKS